MLYIYIYAYCTHTRVNIPPGTGQKGPLQPDSAGAAHLFRFLARSLGASHWAGRVHQQTW